MKRRDATVALAALAVVPRTGEAQSSRPYRLGFLGVSSARDYAPLVDAFLKGLRELGYEEGRTIVVEYRWAEGREERLQELAAQLVRLNPDVLVSHSIGVHAVQSVTSKIPIVMGVSADPVGFGLIRSLAKPGGNTTGVASQITDLAAKRLELLKEVVPGLRDVAVLSNFAVPASARGLEEMEVLARKLGIHIRSFGVTAEPITLDAAFATILRERPDGLVVQPDPVIVKHGGLIARFAASNRLPAIGGSRQFVIDGGLLSYGANFFEGWRLAARYVDRILKGAKPADLPVEQPTTFELAINQKTAKASGLTLSSSLLLQASHVIQ